MPAAMKSPTHAAVPADPAGTGEAPGPAVQPGKVLGIFDLGSNSVRLMLVRVGPVNASCTVLNQVKHMVRLGEGVFLHGRLNEEAMQRTVHVLQGMAGMCSAYGVTDIVACATAAVRDADNAPAFLKRVREHTGLTFTVISGREEARLIYLGVASGLEYSEENRLFIDIGGGSTELIVGNSHNFSNLDSVKVGCVRLSNQFFGADDGPVSAARYRQVQDAIRNQLLHAVKRIEGSDLAEAVGSSGTIQNLAAMAAAADQPGLGKKAPEARFLTYDKLLPLADRIRNCTLEERRALPGINPKRADVIVAGAAIVQTLMEELGVESISVSNRSLQNGILLDYLMRTRPDVFPEGIPTREQSVLQLGRLCRFEERHSRHVADLALMLFDSAASLGLHKGGKGRRELLRYAGLLHDVGIFISFENHHAHSHYLIRNKELLGFTDEEIDVLAATVYFHRKRASPKYEIFAQLAPARQEAVRILSLFLTLAERLDKTHCQLVRAAEFQRRGKKLELHIKTVAACPMELREMERSRKLLHKVLGEKVGVRLVPCDV